MSYKYSKFVIIISTALMTIFLSACSSDSAWQKNMNMGERYLQDENYQDAISAFSKAIEINDKKPEAYIERGNVYAILEGNENKLLAISDYEKALTIDESLVNIYKKLYDIYIEEGLNEQAKNILQIGTEKTCDETLTALLDDFVKNEKASLTANVNIERIDNSIYNESGEKVCDIYFDKATIEPVRDKDTTINKLIEKNENEFLNLHNDEREDIIRDSKLIGVKFSDTMSAEITNNDNGILSIRYTQDYMMGGVHSIEHTGVIYDLKTGKEAELENIFNINAELLSEYFKAITRRYVAENYISDLNDNVAETINNYTIKDYKAYIKNGEVFLCIPTYSLTYGAVGSFEIPTSLYLDASKNISPDNLAQTLYNSDNNGIWYEYNIYSSEYEQPYGEINIIETVSDGKIKCAGALMNSGFSVDFGEGNYAINANKFDINLLSGTKLGKYIYTIVPIGQSLVLEKASENKLFEDETYIVLQKPTKY